MNATIGTALGVLAFLLSLIPIYYMRKANARANDELRNKAVDDAVTAAKAPLIAENARLSGELAAAKVRITQLEDWLYGGKKQ